jgi:RNase P subunit RPR2
MDKKELICPKCKLKIYLDKNKKPHIVKCKQCGAIHKFFYNWEDIVLW